METFFYIIIFIEEIAAKGLQKQHAVIAGNQSKWVYSWELVPIIVLISKCSKTKLLEKLMKQDSNCYYYRIIYTPLVQMFLFVLFVIISLLLLLLCKL